MKILQVAIQPNGGGAEKVAKLLHIEFMKSSESILIYLNADVSGLIENSFSMNLPKTKITRYLIGAFRLRKLASRFKPDVTLIHCEEPQLISALTPSLGSMFYIEHQPLLYKDFRSIIITLVHFILRLRRAQIIHLRKSRGQNEMSLVASNPIADMPKRLDEKISSNWNQEFKLSYIGRLSAEKGFNQIPDIIRGANESSIDVFGDGPLRSSTNFQGLDVCYKGFDPNVWERITNTTLLLIPSLWEGDGLVIVEALCLEVPFLVSNFDGLDELPVPASSICMSNQEMSRKIKMLRRGDLLPENLINVNARQELLRSRNLEVVSKWYLSTFKGAVDARFD